MCRLLVFLRQCWKVLHRVKSTSLNHTRQRPSIPIQIEAYKALLTITGERVQQLGILDKLDSTVKNNKDIIFGKNQQL